MKQTLIDFIQDLPLPLRIGRRTKTSVDLDEREYDAVQYLAHHPSLRQTYAGHMSTVIRHALDYFIWDMQGLVDKGWKPLAQKIHEHLVATNVFALDEAVTTMLDTKARLFHTLLDFDEQAAALVEYDRLLGFCYEQPDAWRRILLRKIVAHAELSAFRTRLRRLGFELELKEIEEARGL